MKERQRQLREDAILDAAIDFIQVKGYGAMTLDDITESIGISRPTLYQHFSSKEEMVLHVALRNIRRGIEKLRELNASEIPPIDRLTEFLDWGMENRFGSCRSSFSDVAYVVLNAKARHPGYLEAESRFKEGFTSLIEAAQETRSVRSDICSRLLAEAVMAIYKSASIDELIQKNGACIADVRDALIKLLSPCPSH
jgi:AcrR family transcriptional regulator